MKRCALALVGVVTAACTNVLSLSPVVTASAAATDDRLLGEWIADDTSDRRMHVSIRRGAARSYVLDFVEGRDSTTAIGHLMPLGQRWLLNLSPTPDAVKAIDRHNGMPIHVPVVLRTSEDFIEVSLVDADSMKARVRRGEGPSLGLAYPPGGDLLLTDTTARLGPALSQYLLRPGVTRTWMTYRRPVTPARIGALSASERKGTLYGGLIGAGVGAIVGVVVADPDPRVMFSGTEYSALGGALLGGIVGMIVGGVVDAVR